MPEHPLETNGILILYNMFPYQYTDITAMTRDLQRVAALGFNAVWWQSMAKTGECAIEMFDRKTGVFCNTPVSGSLYGISEHHRLDPRFAPASSNVVELMRHLTREAKKHGLVPLFDLVLNHVAADSPLCEQHREWFLPIDPLYPDVRPFNYENQAICDEIIDKFWRPYLELYIGEYGFDGIRSDMAWRINKYPRQRIYALAHDLVRKYHDCSAIIFDEALYKGPPHQEVLDRVQTPLSERGATHTTAAGAYFASPSWTGEMPYWSKYDEQVKSQMVSHGEGGIVRETYLGGSINFSGNHDELSLAGLVIEEMARERIKSSPDLLCIYRELEERFHDNDEKRHAYCRQVLYQFIQDIEREIYRGQANTREVFEKRVHEKIAIAAFTSKAGWYLLCGDEYGDTSVKSVFRHSKTQEDFYPHRKHKVFDLFPDEAEAVLEDMAESFIQNEQVMREYYQRLSHPLRACLRQAYKKTLKTLVHADESEVVEDFFERIKRQGVPYKQGDYRPAFRCVENHWCARQDFSEFIRQINLILKKLRPARGDFSCEVFKLDQTGKVWAFVRTTHENNQKEVEIVLINTSPKQTICFDKKMQDDLCVFVAARAYQKEAGEVIRLLLSEDPAITQQVAQIKQAGYFLGEGLVLSPEIQKRVRQDLLQATTSRSFSPTFFRRLSGRLAEQPPEPIPSLRVEPTHAEVRSMH
ncbi:MAG: hypothetical protein HY939_04075 [Gammaproteobacteria bacterium]|nr:hypothetical protein [Gammaproteobacteria bacterium]